MIKKNINVLITGAGGQIGQGLLKKISNRNKFNEIWTIARDEIDKRNIESVGTFNIITKDLSKALDDSIYGVLKEIDVVVHLAALVHNPKAEELRYYDINYEATRNLLESFKTYSKSTHKQFVYISSVSVFGNYKDGEYVESDNCFPESPYAKSKLLAEEAIKHICSEDNSIQYTIIRPATIYCKKDKGNVGKMIDFISKYHFWPVFGNGGNKKSLVYIDDVVDGIFKCISNNMVCNEVLTLSSDGCSIYDIAASIKLNKNQSVFILKVPLFIVKKFKIVQKLTTNNIYSYKKAAKLLGYDPVSLQTGFKHVLKK